MHSAAAIPFIPKIAAGVPRRRVDGFSDSPDLEEPTMSKLQIIIRSTHPGRVADQVAPWVIEGARAHGGFDVSQTFPAVFRISAAAAAMDEVEDEAV